MFWFMDDYVFEDEKKLPIFEVNMSHSYPILTL